LHSKRDTPDCAGVALLLTPQKTARSLAQLTLRSTAEMAQIMANPDLENLRTAIPALRVLPLLQMLAKGESGTVCLDYLAPMQLSVDLKLC
jgi:hypothetical protein